MRVEDFIKQVSALTNHEDIWNLFINFTTELGIKAVIYSYRIKPNKRFENLRRLSHSTVCATVNNIEIRSTAPEKAAYDYVSKRLYEIDPMDFFLYRKQLAPHFYHENMLPKDHERRADLDRFHRVIKSHNFQSGLYIPALNTLQHLPGGVGLYSEKTLSDFTAAIEPVYTELVLATHYMDRHFRMHLNKVNANELGLSSDQFEIMTLVAKGYGNNDICGRLDLKMPTVSYHLKIIREKLDASHNREIPIAAIRAGLVDL